jgi:tetratricopeptide (TPR) repeat protein
VKRVFLLGESAAMGDPDPRFGLLRMLEALLRQRFPEQEFEFVNVAFTAINSHVILPIARECARREGDVWIIYMGNNEVVGPFGSGTVFGRQVPPLTLARASIALKSLRIAQAIEAAAEGLRRGNRPAPEWGGMEMFVEQQVQEQDQRLERVYAHFEHNLQDILEVGRRAGVGMVLSTVGTNLRDCAPFASLHRAGLRPEQLTQWEAWAQVGMDHQNSGDHAEALEAYEQALAIDDQYAELQFRVATCLQSLGRNEDALDHYRRARDADTLRFRADTRLNNIIRGLAERFQAEAVRFFDGEEVLAQRSPGGLTGHACFYEHVHLTPHGNYLLARGLAEPTVQLLDLKGASRELASQWASEEECRCWLGLTDRGLHSMLSLMLRRMAVPPFTRQLNHGEAMRRLEEDLHEYRSSTRPTQVQRMARFVQGLVADRPTDVELRSVFAELLDVAGEESGAQREWEAVLAGLPNAPNFWYRFGKFLESRGRHAESHDAYRRCLELFPEHAEARASLRALSH